MRRNLVDVITTVPGGARILERYRQLHPRGQKMLEFALPEAEA